MTTDLNQAISAVAKAFDCTEFVFIYAQDVEGEPDAATTCTQNVNVFAKLSKSRTPITTLLDTIYEDSQKMILGFIEVLQKTGMGKGRRIGGDRSS